MVEAGFLSESLLAARVGGFEHVGAGVLRHAKRLGYQRRHVLVADAIDQRQAAHDLVAVGNPVDRADARRRRIELRQV